jgi:hypothetical protein
MKRWCCLVSACDISTASIVSCLKENGEVEGLLPFLLPSTSSSLSIYFTSCSSAPWSSLRASAPPVKEVRKSSKVLRYEGSVKHRGKQRLWQDHLELNQLMEVEVREREIEREREVKNLQMGPRGWRCRLLSLLHRQLSCAGCDAWSCQISSVSIWEEYGQIRMSKESITL